MTQPAASVSAFKQLQRSLWTRDYTMKILSFDGATVAPERGAAARGEALGALAEERHRLLTGSDAQDLVTALSAARDAGTLDEQTAFELNVFARDQREALAVPAEEEAAWTRLVCEADAVWHRVKPTGDWEAFAPYVDRIVATLKQRAARLNPAADPYDVMLDLYERGISQASVDAFFSEVRASVVPLVRAITERGEQPSLPFRAAHGSHDAQMALSRDLMALLGLEMDGAALAETEHPFSEGFAAGDVRVATHIYEDDVLSNVYSVIHEAGHALYEQNVDPAYAYTCLEGGTSMGIHESQSRLMENMVGRSRAFMEPLLELLAKRFPETYASVTADELYRAANIAQPSLVRLEADELTYPLHIMIRYEVEQALFAGEAAAADVPALWQSLTRKYLGLEVPNNTVGCLQDTHWSGGDFGYFPTYALGSAYAAQFVAAMRTDGVAFDAACAAGNLAPINAWLRERIWRWGRAKDADELVRGACGTAFDPGFYCRYLTEKFSALYSL